MKKLWNILFHRCVLVGFALVLQVAALIVILLKFQSYFVYFYGFCVLLSLIIVLRIINGRSNPGYKIAWIVPILLVPIFGVLFYLMFGGNRLSPRVKRKMQRIQQRLDDALRQDPPVLPAVEAVSGEAAAQARYLQHYAGCPPYAHTETEYLPSGEIKFERMKEALSSAERFIFLEYFIIEEGVMWNALLEIMAEKAAHGVDVRVIYDDVGCLMKLPAHYNRRLEALGIQCCVFNPFVPVLTARLNNRDHRKIAVIDGKIGFTGGVNLADEYINVKQRYGHWRDAAILLRGDAVWSLTAMFLSTWSHLRHTEEEFSLFRPSEDGTPAKAPTGFVQPYADSPLDNELVGETVFFNTLAKARRYVYMTTPYLILDNEMVTALSTAAKSGVDVRIVTPSVSDNRAVHAVTRANYDLLIENGVRIYEYTPGFIHEKLLVCDDQYATVGTVNMDYRSLYLHFECGVWLFQTDSVRQIREDIEQTISQSREITAEDCRTTAWYRRAVRSFLRAFAPLM